MDNKVYVCDGKEYEKYSPYDCAGLIFDANSTSSLKSIDNLIKNNKTVDWIIVDYKNKENIIIKTSEKYDLKKIKKYFKERKEDYFYGLIQMRCAAELLFLRLSKINCYRKQNVLFIPFSLAINRILKFQKETFDYFSKLQSQSINHSVFLFNPFQGWAWGEDPTPGQLSQPRAIFVKALQAKESVHNFNFTLD